MLRLVLPLSCFLGPVWFVTVDGFAQAQNQARAASPTIDANGYEIKTSQISEDSPNHQLNFHKYVTRPDIDAPRFNVRVHDAEAVAAGYWFLAPYEDKHQDGPGGSWVGPAIYDSSGDLVWSGTPQFQGWNSFDFKPITVAGRRMLSLIWRHDEALVLDEGYQEYKKINVSIQEEGAGLNMHDFNLIEDGRRALLIKTRNGHSFQSFRMGGGYSGDCPIHYYGFEELDTATSQAVFSWSSEGHIDLEETFSRRDKAGEICKEGPPYDYVHANSIDKFPDGDYLLNSRNCNSMFKISHRDGSIVWRFGGSKSDFNFREKFQGQHHARVRSQNETHTEISFLDNSYLPFASPMHLRPSSRGLLVVLRTDTRPMTAQVLEQYEHPYNDYAEGRGSYQVLPNGNTFIGWTAHALHTEYAADGRLIMEAFLKADLKSYRSYKGDWVGHPVQPPDIYAETKSTNGGKGLLTAIWVSWNGATEVSEWHFYRTTPDGSLRRSIGSLRREGFETLMVHQDFASHVYAEAVDRDGAVLRQSKVVKTVLSAEHVDCDDEDVERAQSWFADWTGGITGDYSAPQVVVLFSLGFLCSLICCASWCALRRWRRKEPSRGAYARVKEEASEGGGEAACLVSKTKKQPSS